LVKAVQAVGVSLLLNIPAGSPAATYNSAGRAAASGLRDVQVDLSVRQVCRIERRVLMAESKVLHQMRRQRAADPGAVFTIEVAMARIDAELQCVAAAESHAGERLIDTTAEDSAMQENRPG
jgi:hypothetical protein